MTHDPDCPRVVTIQLAVSVLGQLARDLEEGGPVVMRRPDGSEKEIDLTFLDLTRPNRDGIEVVPPDALG